jgi:hypothetical protein
LPAALFLFLLILLLLLRLIVIIIKVVVVLVMVVLSGSPALLPWIPRAARRRAIKDRVDE